MVVGVLHTLLLLTPAIVLAVGLTELFFELSNRNLWGTDAKKWLPIIGAVPLLAALFIRPYLALRRREDRDLDTRDRFGEVLTLFMLVAIASLVTTPILFFVDSLVDSNPVTFFTKLTKQLSEGIEQARTGRGLLLWSVVALASLVALVRWRLKGSLLVPLFGAAGPLVVAGLYLLACLLVINSSTVDPDNATPLVDTLASFRRTWTPADDEQTEFPLSRRQVREVNRGVARLLKLKLINGADYGEPQIDVRRTTDGQVTINLVVVYRSPDVDSSSASPITPIKRVSLQLGRGWEFLATHFSTKRLPTLTIRLEDASCLRSPDTVTTCRVVIPELRLLAYPPHTEWWFYFAGLLLWAFNCRVVSVNHISLHGFYRDRLSRTFLIEPDSDGRGVHKVDCLKLSALSKAEKDNGTADTSSTPYHLINTALNLQGSNDVQLRDRKTVSFLLSSRYSGSDKTGYVPTREMEKRDRPS